MIIGIPAEVKFHEGRVSCVPGSVRELVALGHSVFVQAGAGEKSGFSDAEYIKSGATVLPTAKDVWTRAEMIIKVKEPVESEYDLIQENQILYTYLHLAAVPGLVPVLIKKNVTAIAYETIQMLDGSLPLLQPMSQVAGKMSVQIGASLLECGHGGKGLLLGGVPGVRRGRVTILGGGVVGTSAAKVAIGMGAEVSIIDKSLKRLEYLEDIFGSRANFIYSTADAIRSNVRRCDLLIGAVLVPGARAPHLVTRDMVAQMEAGSVIVDVAVDQGGCVETIHGTTHENPTYVVDGVVHYGVTNMPGAVARTSTLALNSATLEYAKHIAQHGVEACRKNSALLLGLNVYQGKMRHPVVARDLGYEYVAL